jgi:hypothetical protein
MLKKGNKFQTCFNLNESNFQFDLFKKKSNKDLLTIYVKLKF